MITVFVVGQDAALEKNAGPLGLLAAEGHEIGNHSFRHEPWLHLYDAEAIAAELQATEEHLQRATGQRPVGFRGPGFSLSADGARDPRHAADTSTMLHVSHVSRAPGPGVLLPLGEAGGRGEEKRKLLFGRFSEGFRPMKPYRWAVDGAELIEIPVTTMPIFGCRST